MEAALLDMIGAGGSTAQIATFAILWRLSRDMRELRGRVEGQGRWIDRMRAHIWPAVFGKR